jgi:hypothetical protein
MLYQQLKEEQLKAQKAQDVKYLGVIRLLTSELSYKAIENKGEVSDAEAIAVLNKEAKKRVESIAMYEKYNDVARADQEKYELEIIKRYLPELMSEEEVLKIVDEVAKESGITGGRLIGLVSAKLKGKADGSVIARIVNEKYK